MHAKWPNVVTFLSHQSLLTFQMLSTEHGLVAAHYKALPVMLLVIARGVVIVLLAKGPFHQQQSTLTVGFLRTLTSS